MRHLNTRNVVSENFWQQCPRLGHVHIGDMLNILCSKAQMRHLERQSGSLYMQPGVT